MKSTPLAGWVLHIRQHSTLKEGFKLKRHVSGSIASAGGAHTSTVHGDGVEQGECFAGKEASKIRDVERCGENEALRTLYSL